MEKHSFEDWINKDNSKECYRLLESAVTLEDVGYWVQFEYDSGRKQNEFIFYNKEIQN